MDTEFTCQLYPCESNTIIQSGFTILFTCGEETVIVSKLCFTKLEAKMEAKLKVIDLVTQSNDYCFNFYKQSWAFTHKGKYYIVTACFDLGFMTPNLKDKSHVTCSQVDEPKYQAQLAVPSSLKKEVIAKHLALSRVEYRLNTLEQQFETAEARYLSQHIYHLPAFILGVCLVCSYKYLTRLD
jgi:hypothetical protein